MTTDAKIQRPGARPPRRRIENDTVIVPSAVADAVWEEACVYLQAELPVAWRRRLAVRANLTYRRNEKFRKLLRKDGDRGRDWLWAFSRHWLAALLHKHRPELYARLPARYSFGADLPARSSRCGHADPAASRRCSDCMDTA